MASLNKVILIGHLTADPELKQTPSGVSVTSFSIGISRRYAKGEQAQTDFINIVAWRSTAEFITKYFRKGNVICICGSLQTRNFTDQRGNKHYVTEVAAEEASFVEKKSEAGSNASAPSAASAADAAQFEEIEVKNEHTDTA
ncbi:MAG: single-stranded DNA-binding protein [Clostridia bacterium]|nr:single-stranded DNA-binding protein [Clostridia bacterium]